MNDNHLPKDDLLRLIFGESDDSRQADVRKEVAEDAELADTVRALTAAVEAVQTENTAQPGDDFNDRLRQRMSEVLDPTPVATTHSTSFTQLRTTWRWIMHSRVSRITAAAMFVFAILGVTLWFSGTGTTSAFAAFIEPILESKTVQYKMVTEMKGLNTATTTAVVMMLNANQSRSEQEIKMPGQPKRKFVQIWDNIQGKTLQLDPAEKRATLFCNAKRPKKWEVKSDNPFWLHSFLKDAPDTPDKNRKPLGEKVIDNSFWFHSFLKDAQNTPGKNCKPLGEKEIDGQRVIGFLINNSDGELRVWGDPKTGRPVRMESTPALMPNTKLTMYDFEFDVKMDESLFSVEPPAGYELTEVQNAPSNNSPPREKDLIDMFRCYCEVSGGRFPDLLDLELISFTYRTLEWCAANRRQFNNSMEERQQKVSDADSAIQRGMAFTLLPKEADSHYAGKGVMLDAVDTPIFWYRPKKSEKYRVIYADLSVREAETPPNMPDSSRPELSEQNLIDMLRFYSKANGGSFPNSLDITSFAMPFMMNASYSGNEQKLNAERAVVEAVSKFRQGLKFINSLPKEADSHYAGQNVSFGATDTPVFWYHPKDTRKYRVIFADLSVRDVDTLPSAPDTIPEQGLINALRYYLERNNEHFPDSLDMQMLMKEQVDTKKAQEQGIQLLLEAYVPGKGEVNEDRKREIKNLYYKMMDLGNLPKKEKQHKEQIEKLGKQILDLVDWETLAPGKKNLSDKQKQEILQTRTQEYMKAQMPKLLAAQMPKTIEAMKKAQSGAQFVNSLPPDADMHYVGKGVSFDAADTPIFWYRPKGSKTYRVIYADLSVKERTPEEIKKIMETWGEE